MNGAGFNVRVSVVRDWRYLREGFGAVIRELGYLFFINQTNHYPFQQEQLASIITVIQAWIERIRFHIQEVIRLEGGIEYKEGRPKERLEDVVSAPVPSSI